MSLIMINLICKYKRLIKKNGKERILLLIIKPIDKT